MPTAPQVDYCLVSDDLRLELGSKATILGFYGMLPRVKILLKEWNKPIERLIFMISTHGADAKYNAHIKLLNPDGTAMAESASISGEPAATANDNSAIAFGLMPVVFTQQGLHKLEFFADNVKVYENSFFVGLQPESSSVGRNEMCPCGSGKKFKKCHGLNS